MQDTNATKTAGGIDISEDFLNNILNTTSDPIFVKDSDSRFILANDALCAMLGMSRENILGKTLAEALPKDQIEGFLKIDRMVLESGEPNVTEELLTGKDGKVLTIITKKTRYVDKEGNKFLVAIIHDISDRKRVEKAMEENLKEIKEMNELMVGRETKMIELKNEIEKLKKSQKA